MAGPDRIVARGRWFFRAVVTLIILGVSSFVVLDPRYDSNLKNWGAGMIGAVAGYWFR